MEELNSDSGDFQSDVVGIVPGIVNMYLIKETFLPKRYRKYIWIKKSYNREYLRIKNATQPSVRVLLSPESLILIVKGGSLWIK